MKLALIWAMAENRCIGRDNTLPWHLPQDLKYFKRVTMGKPLVMGRRTWDSIGRPLPGRTNIVITRDDAFRVEGVQRAASLDEALQQARGVCRETGAEEVMVIGGAEIYGLALPHAEKLYLTLVHAEVEGDAFFPHLDLAGWSEISREDHSATDDNPYDYSFLELEKRHQSSI